MKYVDRIETSDGVLHTSAINAQRHAQKRYGEALTRLAHKLVQCEKYVATAEFIDENINAFVALSLLKKDIVLEPREEDES